MRAIEERMAEAERYELSVGHLSEGNLRPYRRLGYRQFGEHTVSPGCE
jgi:hypothetical protein